MNLDAMPVAYSDIKSQNAAMRGEIEAAIRAVLDDCAFAGGRHVDQFEEAFASFCGCRHAAGVGSGTEALWLALLAAGADREAEVITVPMTFSATAEAIAFAGARPVFVDIDDESYTMNTAALEAAITPRTRAVVPVHLFGRMANMDAIVRIAENHGVPVIEDAAQAHGAMLNGKPAGSHGTAGCFSFYPGKNLGSIGDAGAVVSNDTGLIERIRMLRNHGQRERYTHGLVGWNARMDGIHGAVLSVKLRRLANGNLRRRQLAGHYRSRLEGIPGVRIPRHEPGFDHVFHVYAVRVEGRDDLQRWLAENGVECRIHYPIPLHLQPAWNFLGNRKGDFPVSERCAAEFLSLPIYPELTLEQVDHVANLVVEWAGRALAAA